MVVLNFDPFPLFETERLVLRKLTPDDAPAMYDLRTDKIITEQTSITAPGNVDEAAAYIEKILGIGQRGEGVMWGMVLKALPGLIGTICFWNIDAENYRAEIGYILLSAYHQRGLMQEAMAKVLPYGFEVMKLHSIEANIDPANVASKKILERNNFVREGYFKDRYFEKGRFVDAAVYTLFGC